MGSHKTKKLGKRTIRVNRKLKQSALDLAKQQIIVQARLVENPRRLSKLKLNPQPKRDTVKVQPSGRFIACWSFLDEVIQVTELHSKSCTSSNIVVLEEKCSLVILQCQTCGSKFQPLKERVPENKSHLSLKNILVWTMYNCASNYEMINSLFSGLSLKFPFYSFGDFQVTEEVVFREMLKLKEVLLKKNNEEEYKLSVERGDTYTNKDGEVYGKCQVVVDGGWMTRSFRHSARSLAGVGVIIGFNTKYVLDVDTRLRYCQTCKVSKSDPVKQHFCQKNWNSSPQAMEPDIIAEGFKNSMSKHKMIYNQLIGDGDSATYTTVLKRTRNVYPLTVTKALCVNHGNKCYNTHLYEIASNKGSKYQNSQMKFFRENQPRFGKAVRAAINFNSSHVNDPVSPTHWYDLQEDLFNIPFHIHGDHSDCKPYFNKHCDKTKPNLVPQLKNTKYWTDIKDATFLLAKKASQLLPNLTSNRAEFFMSKVAKFIQGKRINFAQRFGYNMRIISSLFSYQFGSFWIKDVFQMIYPEDENIFWEKRHGQLKKKLKRLQKSIEIRRLKSSSENHGPLQKKSKKSKDKKGDDGNLHYGVNCQAPDIDETEYKVLLVNLRKSLQVSEAEQQNIECITRSQSYDSPWPLYRRNRITGSVAGKIFKMRDSTNNTNMVKSLLKEIENNDTLSISDPRYIGKTLEPKARDYYASNYAPFKSVEEYDTDGNLVTTQQQQREDVTSCGIIISLKNGELATTPDGKVGESGLIEIKCATCRIQMIPKRTDKFLVEIVKDKKVADGDFSNLRINTNHIYFYQCVNHLHVSQKTWVDFVVYHEVGEIQEMFVQRITKVDTESVWKQLEEKLLKFFEHDLAPEVIDSREDRNMPIRQPEYRQKAIKEMMEKRQAKAPLANTSTES